MEQIPREPHFSSQESEPLSVRHLSRDDFLELVYQGDRFPDSRFDEPKNGGVFRHLDLQKVNDRHTYTEELEYFVAEESGLVITVAELEQQGDSVYVLAFINTDPAHPKKGGATKVLREVCAFVKQKDAALKLSTYTDEGEAYIQDKLAVIAQEAGIELLPA